jgi:hypothetical protein
MKNDIFKVFVDNGEIAFIGGPAAPEEMVEE